MPSESDLRNATVVGWFEYGERRPFCDYCKLVGGPKSGFRGYVLQARDQSEYRIGGTCARTLNLRINGNLVPQEPRESRVPKLRRTPRNDD